MSTAYNVKASASRTDGLDLTLGGFADDERLIKNGEPLIVAARTTSEWLTDNYGKLSEAQINKTLKTIRALMALNEITR